MRTIRQKLIHLHRCRGITRRTMRKILQHDPTLTKIYLYSSTQIHRMFSLPMKNASLLYTDIHNQALLQQIMIDNTKYHIITMFDEDYPHMLKPIKDPPLVLYTLGNTSLLHHAPAISVIGTRQPSNEAMGKIEYIVKPLVTRKWIIISGMAKGIDSFAHHVSLNNHGYTIAVLGSGFNHIYPKQNRSLFRLIIQNGLALTEYPPDTPPRPYHFPERNRIISGLSFSTLVIEATERSGTLITVDQALDQGRDVYAIPGSPLLPQTKGCHKMIQDGAKLVQHAQDIIEDWDNVGKNWISQLV